MRVAVIMLNLERCDHLCPFWKHVPGVSGRIPMCTHPRGNFLHEDEPSSYQWDHTGSFPKKCPLEIIP